MFYLLLSRNIEIYEGMGAYKTVSEVIPEFVPEFPDIPIEQRYSQEFLNNCIKSEVRVPLGAGILIN